MKVFFNIEEFIIAQRECKQNFSASIGNFDGVHLGHQQIFKILSNSSKTSEQENILLTFEPNPKLFHRPQKNFLLTTLKEKIEMINDLGIIDNLLVLNFNSNIKQLSPTEFIEKILIGQLNINQIVIGENFRFGENQSGDTGLLKKYFSENLKIIDLVSQDNEIGSSTLIKKYIKEGNLKKANEFLGYGYYIEGVVFEGAKLARKLGFPTANIQNVEKILPKFGVYSAFIKMEDGRKLLAIANVGTRPTFSSSDEPIIEVHIPNFSENLYGQSIKLEFLNFIREEKKFDKVDDLIVQIIEDVKSLDK